MTSKCLKQRETKTIFFVLLSDHESNTEFCAEHHGNILGFSRQGEMYTQNGPLDIPKSPCKAQATYHIIFG